MKKPCRLCWMVKPLEDFHKAKGTKDGRRTECKACQHEIQRAMPSRRKKSDITELMFNWHKALAELKK